MDKYPREHIFINGIESKECKQCKELHPISNFHKDNGTLDGFRGICKECVKHNRKNPKGVKLKAKETYQNYNWLYNEYIVQNKTLAEISREINVKGETIKNWLIKFEIQIKTISQSRMRMLETNDEYRELLENVYENTFSKYKPGFKGKKWTGEDKKRISEDRKNFFSVPANREKQLIHLNKINNSPNVSEKISNTLRKRYEAGELVAWNSGLTSDDDRRILAGERHPLFNDWSSLGEYGEEFTQELKNKILKRDDFYCRECGLTNSEHNSRFNTNLHIHHIDYDKKNGSEDNLISLCVSCHMKTNYNRDEWESHFSRVIDKYYKEVIKGENISKC